jgi:hypothetical protein
MELPTDTQLRWLVGRCAELQAVHAAAFESAALIEPTAEYFPDEINVSPEGVGTLLRRMIGYTPLASDLPVELAFVETDPEAQRSAGGCGTGACGAGACATKSEAPESGVQELESGYRVVVDVADVSHPVRLTTALARAVGAMVLCEGGGSLDAADAPAFSEVVAAACGFGLLLTKGAFIYGKSCGGVNIQRSTRLGLEETTLLLAIFTRFHDLPAAPIPKHLDPTPKEAFAQALAWVDSNLHVVDTLRTHPESLADGVFPIRPVQGFFGRFFARRAQRQAPPELTTVVPAAPPRRKRSAAELERLEQTRALVEEALRTR